METRWKVGVIVAGLVAAACGEASTATTPVDGAATPSTPAAATTSPTATSIPLPAEGVPQGPSALDDRFNEEFPPPLVNLSEIISGGPPPDGIPSIDEPAFVTVAEADGWLQDAEPVVYMEVGGQARAYPVQVLIWHEIINDTIAGVPVSITYCPLCNSAVSYERTINGVETTFGTSGMLYASALVMYDRATESLWTHFDGRAVAGVLTGYQLEPIASPLLAWSEFAVVYPDGQVLDRNKTGYQRSYGSNPYSGYDNPEGFPFLFQGSVDERAAAMQRVVGVVLDGTAVAFTLESIASGASKATAATVGNSPVVVFWRAGQSSALQTATVDAGRDVGSVGVFSPDLDQRTLTFQANDGLFVDDQTGSIWDITGRESQASWPERL